MEWQTVREQRKTSVSDFNEITAQVSMFFTKLTKLRTIRKWHLCRSIQTYHNSWEVKRAPEEDCPLSSCTPFYPQARFAGHIVVHIVQVGQGRDEWAICRDE